MYNFYNTPILEKRHAWRNAYEVKAAALEHEKRRFQSIEDISLAKPQVIARAGRRSGLSSALRAASRLLTILIG